ncbi:MAG: hypothetical protein J6M18_05800 [Actinomycetaceae bacterium]|nr:hypothetical protein [Actinomycetaceae bacterium]
MNKIKKIGASTLALLMCSLAFPAAADAASKTVYYKGTAVYWQYGRTLSQIYGYSEVASGRFAHRATVNGLSSSWVPAGKKNARAEKRVGFSTVRAQWDCKK